MSEGKKKGKTGAKVAGGIGAVGVIGACAYLLTHCGAGFGFGGGGNGDGSSQGSGAGDTTTSVSAEATTGAETTADTTSETVLTAETTAAVETVSVTVSGSDYLYENKSISLDDLLASLKSLEAGTIVTITDDNASLNAYNALTDALKEANISYTEPAAS